MAKQDSRSCTKQSKVSHLLLNSLSNPRSVFQHWRLAFMFTLTFMFMIMFMLVFMFTFMHTLRPGPWLWPALS